MRFMLAGGILSIMASAILLLFGLLALVGGLATADAPTTIGGVIVLVLGIVRLVTTIRGMRRMRQLNTTRAVLAWHLEFLLIALVMFGVGFYSLVTGLGSAEAGARISGGVISALGVVGIGLTLRSMRGMKRKRAIRFAVAWAIESLIGGVLLLGLGFLALIGALETNDASNIFYALLGVILILLGMSDVLWFAGRLRVLRQESLRQPELASAP